MHERRLAPLLIAAALSGGCSAGAQGAASGEQSEPVVDGTGAGALHPSGLDEELCEASAGPLVAEGEPGPYPTIEAALDAFRAEQLSASFNLDGVLITLDGRTVGRVSVAAHPAGGHDIGAYEYCFPATLLGELEPPPGPIDQR